MIIEVSIVCLSQPVGCKARIWQTIRLSSVAVTANEIIENELFACSGVLFTSSFIEGFEGATERHADKIYLKEIAANVPIQSCLL